MTILPVIEPLPVVCQPQIEPHLVDKVVSELLGHSSIGLTLDIYSHMLPDSQEQAATAMDAILGG